MRKQKAKIEKIIKEWKDCTTREIYEGVRDNFIFGFLGATLVVFIATRTDIAVLLGYITYYYFMGKIVNRPKYVTDFGKLIILLSIFILNGCSKNDKEISLIKEINQEDEMIQAYKEGVKALDENDAFFAAKKFLEAELLFPQSAWASKSVLMASYSYYLQNYYSEALSNLSRYLKRMGSFLTAAKTISLFFLKLFLAKNTFLFCC